MSQSNNTGNGCTLEDCHTNLFALTDLAGIKWRRLRIDGSFVCIEPLEDPVLRSFTQCIQSDILCVWRRVPLSSSDRTTTAQLTCHKELWIFWYGDEPVNLRNLLAPELREEDRGCWDHGLSYECRTLLFKALHNLIERCLLSQNFVRIGKWFVQPYPHFNTNTCGIIDKSSHLSIRFSFFLHGESTVCASIDVREHPPLRYLHPHHLAIASLAPIPVLLAPYGLNALLTGESYRETDMSSQKLLEEWHQFYVMPNWDTIEGAPYGESAHVAPVVEVVVAGMRMKYPSCFVMMLAEKEAELIRQHGGNLTTSSITANPPANSQPPVPNTPAQPELVHNSMSLMSPPSPCLLPGLHADSPSKANPTPISGYLFVPTLEPSLDPKNSSFVGKRILEKSWQDATVTSGVNIHGRHVQNESSQTTEETQMNWEFGEPLWKNVCQCQRCRSAKSRASGSGTNNKGSLNVSSKHIKTEKDEKKEKMRQHGRSSSLFHRRMSTIEPMLQHNMDIMMQRIPPLALTNIKSNQTNSLPQLRGTTGTADNVADSPHSAAPSPLVSSQIQPSVNQNGDPTMPTLSPHPPSKNNDKDIGASGSAQGDMVEVGQGSHGNVMNGPVDLPVSGQVPGALIPPGDLFVRPQQQSAPKLEPGIFSAPFVTPPEQIKIESMNPWLDQQKDKLLQGSVLKRPVLPTKSYEEDEEELVTNALYDFEGVTAILEQPVKKIRLDNDNMNGRPGPTPPNSLNLLKGRSRDKSPTNQPRYDPYEFSDDSSSDPGNFKCDRSFRNSRDESFARSSPFGSKQDDEYGRIGGDGYPTKSSLDLSPETPGTVGGLLVSLTREEDLKPKMNDLDNIFDTDSESSDPDLIPNTVQEDSSLTMKRNLNTNMTVPTTNISELTQMFPTPPSQETQHALSPGNLTEIPQDMDVVIAKVEPIAHIIDDRKNHVLDWSFVHKPPNVCMYVGSSKYAPVELPSSHLPPMTSLELQYKPSWHQFSHMPIMDKQVPLPPPPPPPSHYPNLPSVENIGSVPKPSPATLGPNSAQQRTPRTPGSYELTSPASNASSYVRNLNSVDPNPTNSQRPESHSLVVNVMLSDSVLNLFKDHNFDSCSMCVCNMNIKGTDIVTYIPDKNPEAQYICTCGFSAVVNRKYGVNSGLFYEDEVDITGDRNDRLEGRKRSLASLLNQDNKELKDKLDTGELMPQELLMLIQRHFSTLCPSSLLQLTSNQKPDFVHSSQEIVSLEEKDGCEACASALEVGRQAADNCGSHHFDEGMLRDSQLLHKWPYLQGAKTPTNSQDVVRVLKSLQPLLQDAIQKKRTTRLWESVYTIMGPLSWKDFHLLAGRGSKETSEPQPVPPLLVGYDKDWLGISPFALQHWDKMLVEPYSHPQDMAYVIIVPDNKYTISHVQSFFQELGRNYESARLGRHRPFTKKFKDGIMRISASYFNKVAEESVDEWFNNLGNSPLAVKIKQYTQVCSKYLAPFLAQQTLDKSIFEPPSSSRPPSNRSQGVETHHPQGFSPAVSASSFSSIQSGSIPPSSHSTQSSINASNSDSQQNVQAGNSEDKENENKDGVKDGTQDTESEPTESETPSLCIYMVEPFSYGQDWQHMNRLATLGLLRCFQEMIKVLPEHLQMCTQLQIIPQKVIIDSQETAMSQHIKNLCMSVYTQSRRPLSHTIPGRSLTGFGPAAAADQMLKAKLDHHIGPLQLYTPPYILGNLKKPVSKLAEVDKSESSGVLLCAYCLSEDQRWLLGVCTDSNGEILETCTINIDIPNRNRRKKASARRIGLRKLWDFIFGVLCQTAQTWRIVIGRFGRLGHGELKGWACLLNKKHLQSASNQLRSICVQCDLLTASDSPGILSACLVSMESHPSLHIMTDSLQMDERRSSNCQLSTPEDASCTHILVFPTSARAQATQDNPKEHNIDLHGPDLGMGDEILGEEDLMSGLADEDISGMGGIDDLLSGVLGISDPVCSPQNPSHPGSPNHGDLGCQTLPMADGMQKCALEEQEENHALLSQALLQQPLAMGFYISTAKTGPMPKWFWGVCPHREDVCPACFKSALHIHCPNVPHNHDEFDQSTQKHSHPLDSNLTCDVLRYVLETYNALSWLTMDSATNDRRSCLPAHFVVLLQLCQAFNSLV